MEDHITTTAGEPFTLHESCVLAALVYKRFGRNIEAAVAAWRRMMQNNTTKTEFMALVVSART